MLLGELSPSTDVPKLKYILTWTVLCACRTLNRAFVWAKNLYWACSCVLFTSWDTLLLFHLEILCVCLEIVLPGVCISDCVTLIASNCLRCRLMYEVNLQMESGIIPSNHHFWICFTRPPLKLIITSIIYWYVSQIKFNQYISPWFDQNEFYFPIS